MIYESINMPVFMKIPNNVESILDIGCGTGELGKIIKHNSCSKVIGITYSETEAMLASKWIDQVIVEDINSFNPDELGDFDCIICSHILEHLYHPQELLIKLRHNLKPDGILIIALPNILHWKQRLEFLKGNFKYTDGGLMDRTHFRFFDWDTAADLVQSSGFKIRSRETDGYFPLPKIRKFMKPLASSLDQVSTRIMPGFFGVQFIITAQVA